MKQSTTFAQVATNQFDYLSSALCANTPPCKKHSSSRKFLILSISLRLLLVMFLTLSVTTNAWGADVTFTTTSSGGFSSNSKTANGVTVKFNGSPSWQSGHVRVYSKATISFSSTNNNITKIVMTATSADYAKTWSADVGSTDVNNTTITWTGSAKSITLTNTASAQSRLSKIVVTTADSHTVTWTINPAAGGSLSPTSGTSTTVTPNVAYTYGSPAYTVTPAGKANVSQDGDNFTATPSANCTIQINMVEKTRATISFENMGNPIPTTTGYYVGDTYTLPSENDFTCGTKTFVGWSTEIIENSPTKPTAATYFEPGAPVTLAANQTFYAVFATSSGNGSGYTKLNWGATISAGKYLISTGNYTISGRSGNKTSELAVVEYSPKSNEAKTEYEVKIEKIGDYFSIKLPDDTWWVGWNTSTSTNLTNTSPNNDTKYLWRYTENGIQNISAETRYLQVNYANSAAKVYTTTNNNTWHATYLYAQATSYIDYTTQCTTETAITLHANDGTNQKTDITTGEKTYTVPPCSFTRTGYNFVKWNTKADGIGTDYNPDATINLDGTAVNLYAIWTPQTYDITYQDQGDVAFSGTHDGGYPTKHTYGTATTLKSATKSGYNFLGWFTTSNCSGSAITQLGATDYTGNITLYAKWEEIPTTCTVTYNANGGIGTPPSDATEYTNGATVTVLGNYGKLTKDGYAFTGWNTKADGSGDSYKHNDQFAITASTTLYAQWCEAYWKLVTNTSELEDDTRIIIAAKEYDFALSTEQKTNNRGQAAITKKYNTVTFGADVQTLTLVGLQDNMFALYTGSGYLYAAGSGSNNYLKTGVSDGNDDWRVSISQGVATILAQGITNTNNQLKYNAGSDLFSCYGKTNSQKDVVIYKEVCKQDSYVISENLSNATAANTNAKTVLATATSLTLNYSADAGYLLPETITVKMGGVALSSTDDYTWNKASGTLTITVTGFYGDVDVTIEAEEDPCYTFTMSEVTATSTTNSIRLTWTEVAGATGYKVRLDEGEFTTETGLTHTFEGLSPKTTYNWEVQAVSAICEDSKTGFIDTQKETFTVSWSVNGTITSTESVVDGESIQDIPLTPSDQTLEDCGANKFMGWSEESAGSTPQDAAYYDDLCPAEDMIAKYPSITSNKTFYAVFATESSGGGAEIGTVVFSEDFSSFNSGDKMTGTLSSGTGRSIYGDVSVTYSYQNGTSADTKIYGENNAGGTSPELLVGKKSSTFTISGIPSAGAAKLQLSYKQNAQSLTSNISGTGYSGGTNSNIKQTTTTIITVGSEPTFNLTFTGPSGDKNVRLDDISIIVNETSISYSNYVTNCCALAPATNLTVSGTTANSATLTWTAPSPTTGITKLQVRNAETDEVAVDDIAINATTATITGLTECTSYQYYVVSVGEDCEVVSNIVTAQPFGGAKTVNYNYNGGSGSPASFTTSCTNQTITLPAATRTGYDFNGWYTDATSGTRVGGANDTYEPATSPVTLHAQWTIQSYTVTWNPNGGNWGGSTANIVETYEYGAAINEPADPTRENGIFKGWNPSVPTTMPAGNKTYTAQWEMVYTLTFVDMNAGGITSTLTQTSSGQNIVAPTANSEVCDMWTFIGWAPSNSLNGGTDKPTGFIAAGETILGSQITENKTYYSVYSYNSDNTQEFEVGKSGTYLMYALSSGTKYYATTAKTGGFYGNPETSFATYGPSKFTLTYNKTEEKYIIYHENTTSGRESQGYFELNTSDGNVDVKSETPSLFTIQAGSNGAFIIRTDYTDSRGTFKERSFGYDDSFTDYSGDNPIYFEPASEIQYYNAANCGEVETYTMSFHNPFGDEDALIWYDAEHEESYYTDKPLNTSIDVFPTMVYNGWTFIGWTPNQQYNDLIGEENLDDENSATNDPADLVSTIYSNEAGWAYKLTSNVTMYPVFTKFEDNEPFDMVNGGDYYIYYIADADVTTSVDEYGVANRIYAGAWESGGTSDSYGATQSCSNATLFTFTKLSNGKWTIYDNTNRKYLCAGATDNNLALNATAATNGEWTIIVHNGNQVNAVSKEGYTLSALSQDAVTGTFKNYATSNFNNNSAYYHRVYVGTCTERVYSSNPSNKPVITLSGSPQVTSTVEQSIRANGTLSISATKLAANGTIILTADNEDVYFATDKTANFSKATKPEAPLTIYADANGKLALTTVYVHYKPTEESTPGIQTVTITATTGTEGQPDYAMASTIATVRNLPAKFVIATKVGATWYALPANMNGATNPEGVVIDVDETTMIATAPNTTIYTLFPVATINSEETDRYKEYGERLRFAAVNNGNKGLWANNSKEGTNINNYAAITAANSTAGAAYEWKITTTIVDGNWQYTLQTDQSNNQKYLRYWTAASGGAKWGTYASGNDKLYFLPVTESKPFDYKVVEWYPTKVLIQTEAAIANPIVKIGGVLVDNVTCTNKGGKLYEISGLPLVNNPTKVLTLSYTADEVTYTNSKVVPIILSRETKSISGEPFVALTKEVYNYADLVVRDGAILTMDGTQEANTLWDVTIYPKSKIYVPESQKLTVHSLTLFGGIDEIYNGSTYTLNKYGVPELSLKGNLKKSISTIDYLMRVNLDQMYSLAVPYDVQLADIKYWDGSDIALGTALYVSAYDGDARANQSKKTWIYETDFESRLGAATLKAGVGYTISAELQSGVGNEYSILRMPMMNNVANDATETAKTVAVTAWGKDANVTDNHKGWNLVGNPYMSSITGADDTDLVLGYLQETGTGPWEWVEKTYRYVTIPADNGKDYHQQKFTEAVLPPFKNFFVQIGTTGDLQFGLGTRQSMPARSTQAAIEKEVELEILMSNDARQDNTGLLISEEYSPAYEINADLEKMIGSMSVYTIYGGYKLAYNALSPINASEWIPMGYIAPAAGEYTFRLDDVEKIAEQVEHVYVIDYDANNIVDLMDDEYEFTTDKEQNDNRFAINVVLIQDKDNTTTGMDMILGNNAAPIKFIHQDKMYIYNEGIIYDATGKQVTNINK